MHNFHVCKVGTFIASNHCFNIASSINLSKQGEGEVRSRLWQGLCFLGDSREVISHHYHAQKGDCFLTHTSCELPYHVYSNRTVVLIYGMIKNIED